MKVQKSILCLCGALYTLCLLFLWNVPTPFQRQTEDTVATGKNIEPAGQAGSVEKPKIAITFDDGPSRQCTPALLDGLKERGVRASFFVIGKQAEENKELILREKTEGHLIGNHTYNHVDITKLADADAKKEIDKTNEIVQEITGEEVEYVRPPFGIWQKKLESEMKVLPVMWSVDPLDWTTENTDEIVNRVVTKVKENDIILLHDCYKSSVDAALRIVDILMSEGYEFVTVDEMILD